MAKQKRFTDYDQFTDLSDDDILLGVDVSDTTDSAEGTTKRLTVNQLVTPLATFTLAYRGELEQGSDLALATEPGVYIGVSNGSYLNLPSGFPPSMAFYLLVYPASTNTNRFKHQELRQFNFPAECWVRRLDSNNPTVAPWYYTREVPDNGVTNSKILNGAVTFEKLANAFSFGGILDSGSANTIAKSGVYLVTAQMDDMPSGSPAQGYLDVRNYSNGSWVVQTFTALLEPDAIWQRVIRIGQQVFYPWVSLKAPTGGLPFAGKHMVFFGDSITENGDYPARVASRLGCTVTNLGIGGTQMAEHNALAYRPFSMCKLAGTIASGDYATLQGDADFLLSDKGKDVSAQVTAMSQIDWNAVDYIVMGYGTNDYGNGMSIGTASDTTGATFCGAVNVTVDTILTAYPHIRLFFVSPMYRDRIASGDGLNSDDNPNINGDYLVEFVDALKERCAAHHVPCLDMYRTSMVGKHTASTYLVDGLHPRTGIGYQLVADKVSAALAGSY